MKDIKILVATHKQYKMPDNDIYIPIHVGAEGKESIGYQKDSEGDNISFKNANYCELTALYWAWKNLDCDYIGLSHYRRYFLNINSLIYDKKDKITSIISSEDINNLLENNDIIVPKKRNYYIENIRTHYKNAHFIKDLEEVEQIIKEKHPSFSLSFEKIMEGSQLHLYNMFIMKKDTFNSYAEWLFSILFELEKRVDISGYDNYQKRIFGFLSERLFNVWLLNQNFNKVEIPVINLEKVHWPSKIKDFLKRKSLGHRKAIG